jgi:hypothetical protein
MGEIGDVVRREKLGALLRTSEPLATCVESVPDGQEQATATDEVAEGFKVKFREPVLEEACSEADIEQEMAALLALWKVDPLDTLPRLNRSGSRIAGGRGQRLQQGDVGKVAIQQPQIAIHRPVGQNPAPLPARDGGLADAG